MNIRSALSFLNGLSVLSNSFTHTVGSLTIDKNIVANNLSLSYATVGKTYQYDMKYSVVCGNGSFDNTLVYHGNTYYSNSITKSPSYRNVNFDTIHSSEYDILDVTNTLNAYSEYLLTIPSTASKRYTSADGKYTFSGNNSINYVTLSTQTEVVTNLSNATELVFKFPKNSVVIVNIIGNNNVTLGEKIITTEGVDLHSILFNIGGGDISANGDLQLNILALNSTLTLYSGVCYSQIIANSIICNSDYVIKMGYFSDWLRLPIKRLNVPKISLDQADYNNSNAMITIIGDSTLFYSIDGSDYVEYISSFSEHIIGEHVVTSYSKSLGYDDSPIATSTFKLRCTCENPEIVFNNNAITLTTNIADAIIDFNIDGSSILDPKHSMLNGETYSFEYDGEYSIVAKAHSPECASSGLSYHKAYVEFPETTLRYSIVSNDQLGMLVEIIPSIPNVTIKYTENSSNPMFNGKVYSGPFHTTAQFISAISYSKYLGYSDITVSPRLNANFLRELIPITKDRADFAATVAQYGEDMCWIGPSVIVDDNTVYQGLVNILSTSFMEIPFRSDFGTSIKDYMFELGNDMTSPAIIAKLKEEIEYNDPRIDITSEASFAFYEESNNSLQIYLTWVNKITNETANINYNYSLDGIL